MDTLQFPLNPYRHLLQYPWNQSLNKTIHISWHIICWKQKLFGSSSVSYVSHMLTCTQFSYYCPHVVFLSWTTKLRKLQIIESIMATSETDELFHINVWEVGFTFSEAFIGLKFLLLPFTNILQDYLHSFLQVTIGMEWYKIHFLLQWNGLILLIQRHQKFQTWVSFNQLKLH